MRRYGLGENIINQTNIALKLISFLRDQQHPAIHCIIFELTHRLTNIFFNKSKDKQEPDSQEMLHLKMQQTCYKFYIYHNLFILKSKHTNGLNKIYFDNIRNFLHRNANLNPNNMT